VSLKKQLLSALLILRASRLRMPLIRLFAKLHNFSYHTVSFFANHNDAHPKHAIQRYEQYFIDRISPDNIVVDIGCGIGQVSYAIADKAAHVYALDFSHANINIARKKYPHPRVHYIVGNALTYAYPERCDVIIMSNVLEHIEDRVSLLKQLKTIAPKILIRVPMITRDWITVYKKNIGVEYRLDDTHYIEYTEKDLNNELHAAGWKTTEQHVAFGELYVTAHVV
jgi:2-polyprenyl-3-methyl-5-hydroxy-6-metoxy-1,4-benzoquinol methylase